MSDGVWFTDSDERSQRVIINFVKMDPAAGPDLLEAIREASSRWGGCVVAEPRVRVDLRTMSPREVL